MNKVNNSSSLSGSVYSNIKRREHGLLDKNSIWLEKSVLVNEMILTVIGYDNVNNMI